jgi:hypothetical protein
MMKQNDSPMFDLSLMDFFYNSDYEEDENVINAWYIYVSKFLPLVNKKWREATTPDNLINTLSMFKYITISDEALMRWFLKIWVPILKSKQEKISKQENEKDDQDNNVGKEVKTSKRGPHDTNVKASIYTVLHHEITNARRNYNAAVHWNIIFWNEVKQRNANFLDNGCSKSSNRACKNPKYIGDLPLPDLNENQEFLASYKLDGRDVVNDNEEITSATKNVVAL